MRHQTKCRASSVGIDAARETDLIQRFEAFCKIKRISTDGILAVTIQRNRTTEFSSLIINWDTMSTSPNNPMEFLKDYKELKVAGSAFLVCFNDNLDPSVIKELDVGPRDVNAPPFCCPDLQPYRPKRIGKESYFTGFVNSQGTHDDVVYEVKEQIDNGPLLSTRFFKLQQGNIVLVRGEFRNKAHAFKNYECKRCKRFFAVDLYRADNLAGGNYHHMRLNPFTKLSPSLLESFFEAARNEAQNQDR
eukprot:TRINITY_DN20913_c0_g1_i1.p1 TRINITY_DN20913_c0_g1~~TRINITY_DN20913_c0_g1_i1.p1  ORF type:complete len:247 (+),score=31.22 TRINITY_DN20913_c0_g1_i1:366-1106(+)